MCVVVPVLIAVFAGWALAAVLLATNPLLSLVAMLIAGIFPIGLLGELVSIFVPEVVEHVYEHERGHARVTSGRSHLMSRRPGLEATRDRRALRSAWRCRRLP